MKIFDAIALSLIAMLSSCEEDVERMEFIIRVTKIEAPDTVKVGENFSARFYGMIGGDGCYRLKNVDSHSERNVGHVKFHGIHEVGPDIACTMATTHLHQDNHAGYDVAFTPESRGNFIISVRLPDNTFLKDTVIVV